MASTTLSSVEIEVDLAAVGQITSVSSILEVLCQMTGMGFAAVARVTDDRWIACAVEDQIGFGLKPGGELDVHTTLCKEVRQARVPVAIDQASLDPIYCNHHTPRTYSIESYVSVPIIRGNGDYFGNLCAIDPRPAQVANKKTVATFVHFAHLIALELDNQWRDQALKRELLEERNSGALREEFIAVLGHDLRNPLSSIAACGHLLKANRGRPEMVLDLANRVGTNVGRMTKLIEDLLDFARDRFGGGLQARVETIDDFGQLVEEVVQELRLAHPGRQVTTSLAVDRPVPGDRVRLQQLVSNLVGNALIHGGADSVIDVRAIAADAQIAVSVHNEGEPIAEETMPGLFDAFTRQGTSTGRGEGLGLGLHICDQIVKAHRGTLEVTSTAQGGTTFTARLPAS